MFKIQKKLKENVIYFHCHNYEMFLIIRGAIINRSNIKAHSSLEIKKPVTDYTFHS